MSTTNTAPVFDAAALSRATNGDPALQVEVLSLFAVEVERLVRQVEDAPDAQLRGDRLRALIAVARNTGATRLAQAARELETQIAAEELDLTPLKDAAEETLAYVQRAGV